MATTRRLGRGLDSLVRSVVSRETVDPGQVGNDVPLGTAVKEVVSNDVSRGTTDQGTIFSDTSYNKRDIAIHDGRLVSVAVGAIRANGRQPRRVFDEDGIRQLSDSLKRFGVLQPIVVRRLAGAGWEAGRGEVGKFEGAKGGEGTRADGESAAGELFEIVAGERRWRAAKLAGLAEVPVVVREASDEQMLEMALVENLQREDLNAIDRARAYRQFTERFGVSAEQVALRVGEDRTTVANYLRLLELPESVQELLASKRLGMAHARAILAEPNGVIRARLAEMAVKQELSVRAIDEIIRRGRLITEGDEALAGKLPVAPGRMRSAHLRDMEERFERVLKTKVAITEGKKKGTGRIVIDFFTLDDFDRVAERLGVSGE